VSSASQAREARRHSDTLAATAVSLYDLTDAALRFVRHGENTVYAVEARGHRFALRLHRPGYQTAAAVCSELAWMASLNAGTVRTPRALRGRNGELVQRVHDDTGERLAVLFTWEAGEPLSLGHHRRLWEQLGETMGRVHLQARDWKAPPWFVRRVWDADGLVGADSHWGDARALASWTGEQGRLLAAAQSVVHRRLMSFGRSPDRFGLIHADLGFENILVRADGTTVLLDFDDAGYSWFLYDVAVSLFPAEVDGGLSDARDDLVRGYRRMAPLPDALLVELPTFLMARRLVTLAWTLSRVETDHARRQRPRRIETLVPAIRRYLGWARPSQVA